MPRLYDSTLDQTLHNSRIRWFFSGFLFSSSGREMRQAHLSKVIGSKNIRMWDLQTHPVPLSLSGIIIIDYWSADMDLMHWAAFIIVAELNKLIRRLLLRK